MRQALPARRPNLTCDAVWDGHLIVVTVGFDPLDGSPREVFASTPRGGAMQATLADAAVLISIGLQHGISPADLAKSLGRVPQFVCGEMVDGPASPVGAVLEIVAQFGGGGGGGEDDGLPAFLRPVPRPLAPAGSVVAA